MKVEAQHYEQAIKEAYRNVYCHPDTLNLITERARQLANAGKAARKALRARALLNPAAGDKP